MKSFFFFVSSTYRNTYCTYSKPPLLLNMYIHMKHLKDKSCNIAIYILDNFEFISNILETV